MSPLETVLNPLIQTEIETGQAFMAEAVRLAKEAEAEAKADQSETDQPAVLRDVVSD